MSTDPRSTALHNFVATHASAWQIDTESLAPASADASFRRYFRVASQHPQHNSFIIMDAPPSHEDTAPFTRVAALLLAQGLRVPEVLASDIENGFLLLSDLGAHTFLSTLNVDLPQAAAGLYGTAFDALVVLQKTCLNACTAAQISPYSAEKLLAEMELFPVWFLGKHCGIILTEKQTQLLYLAFDLIIKNNVAEPQVLVHRDYHSRNLMLPDINHSKHSSPGILDFQDAVIGPMSYDVVSLLRDAYIEWPEPQQIDWAILYWQKCLAAGLPVREDFGQFWRDFEWMGLQRHLKVLGIFARLCHRDGKMAYMNDLPLVSRYVRQVAQRYDGLGILVRLLDQAEGVARPAASFTF